MRAVRSRAFRAALVVLGPSLVGAPRLARAAAPPEEEAGEAAFVDPRKRPPPRRHRFRLGMQMDYLRLTAAVDPNTGETQRFHWAPLQLDFAYQLQFLKVLMLRPSMAFGVNVANTLEAMPIVIHPQIFAGYQGSLLGIAFGYGYFQPPIRNKDSTSKVRGGQGRPVISNNHHLMGEVSFTTRVHRRRSSAPGAGELSIALRAGGVKSTLKHYGLDQRNWRFFVSINIGWYFGDGRRRSRMPPPPEE